MANNFQVELISAPVFTMRCTDPARRVYAANHRRIYALAFWMTGNELLAEELEHDAFVRAYRAVREPTAEVLDRALLTELRERGSVGALTLACPLATEVLGVRRRAKRTELERAVLALPATERFIFLLRDAEGYDIARIARLLGLRDDEIQHGLHQARLRLRELLAREQESVSPATIRSTSPS